MDTRSSRLPEKIDVPARLKRQCQSIVEQMRLNLLLIKHPATPWYAKLVASCAVGYIFSPVQLIPSFIPVIGQLDDVLILYCGNRLLQMMTPPGILASCQGTAKKRQIADLGSTAALPAPIPD